MVTPKLYTSDLEVTVLCFITSGAGNRVVKMTFQVEENNTYRTTELALWNFQFCTFHLRLHVISQSR
jgi:hypothetical protein